MSNKIFMRNSFANLFKILIFNNKYTMHKIHLMKLKKYGMIKLFASGRTSRLDTDMIVTRQL